MNEDVKKLLEENIDLIDSGDFDQFFRNIKDLGNRMRVAEVLMSAGIDITNYTPFFTFKKNNISRFINDLRINRSDITIRRGPLEDSLWLWKVKEDQYVIGLPKDTKLSSRNKFPHISNEYKLAYIEFQESKNYYGKGKYCLVFDVWQKETYR